MLVKKSTRVKQGIQDNLFDIFNYSILTILSILILYPLLYVVSASFSDPLALVKGEVWLFPKGFNLDAYQRVFKDQQILVGYINSINYTVFGTIINIIMTTIGAYPLSRQDFKGKNIITILFTFTMFFSGGLIPSYLTYKNLGLYNNIWVMLLPGAVSMWNLVIMRTFFQNIPKELQEAAFIDGCSNIGVLFKIIMPLSKPVIAVMVMYYGVGHWNAYFNAMIYLKDKAKFPLQLIMREILINENMFTMMGDGTEAMVQQLLLSESLKYAVIIVASLPVLLLYPFLQKYFTKGVMIGAIKG